MSNTYTQIYIHIVFAVKGRQNLIPKEHKTELHGYIMGIITNKKQEEYLEILKRFNVNYDERYIFDPVEEDTEI